MKKLLFIAMLLVSTAAIAQDQTPEAPVAAPAVANNAEAQKQRFTENKERMAKKLGERIEDMQKRKACIEAAADAEALRACAPKRPEGVIVPPPSAEPPAPEAPAAPAAPEKSE